MGDAKLLVFGMNGFNNCLNSRRNSATFSCHEITLPAPSLGSGLRFSVVNASCTRKESQAILQRSVFERSMVLVSNGRREVVPVGTNDFKNCLNSRCAIRSLPRASQVFRQPQAWVVGCDSALSRQAVSGRKANSYDSGA